MNTLDVIKVVQGIYSNPNVQPDNPAVVPILDSLVAKLTAEALIVFVHSSLTNKLVTQEQYNAEVSALKQGSGWIWGGLVGDNIQRWSKKVTSTIWYYTYGKAFIGGSYDCFMAPPGIPADQVSDGPGPSYTEAGIKLMIDAQAAACAQFVGTSAPPQVFIDWVGKQEAPFGTPV